MDDRDRRDNVRNGEIPWRVAELERRCQKIEDEMKQVRERQQDLRSRAQFLAWLVPIGISVAIMIKAWISA